MDLATLCDLHIANLEHKGRSDGTLSTYGTIKKYIRDGVGKITVREATPMLLQSFLNKMAEEHGVGTAKTCKSVLGGMFALARANGAVRDNPVHGLELPSVETEGAEGVPPEQIPKFVRALYANDQLVAWDDAELLHFMMFTGLRIAEACGLCWDCVDFDKGTITIRRQALSYTGTGLHLADYTKTNKSRRRIPIAPAMLDLLHQRKAAQDASPVPNEHDLVFPTVLGNIRDKRTVGKHLREVRDSLGSPDLHITTHLCRKTCATLMHRAGVDDKDIADYLGHENKRITEDVYMRVNVNADLVAKAIEDACVGYSLA
ncbi:MAG: site-specific integrase [Bifidobacterium sp.]|nr:site-specific integrase [Bifidobacterium sp.]